MYGMKRNKIYHLFYRDDQWMLKNSIRIMRLPGLVEAISNMLVMHSASLTVLFLIINFSSLYLSAQNSHTTNTNLYSEH